MKTLLTILFTLPFSITTHAAESARVMLIGTFHFSNPGKDAVKVDDVDIFDEASQHYLQQFAKRLAEFKPTRGLLEFDPAEEELINQRYSDYLAGTYELGTNEIYQLGFRIARESGLKAVQSFDHRDLQWQADASASWWQRNFRMYANIQKVAQPGERIIAIGGSGHMAILKQLLAIDQRLQEEKVDGYF